MAEADVVKATKQLVTIATLVSDLGAMGVKLGMTLLVHTSMSKLGWIAGGPQGVVEALLKAVGPDGTIMMPTQTGHLSDPQYWSQPPVPKEWWATIRAETPAFDPAKTPSREMGAINELFRTWPGVARSHHPLSSFAAIGPNAARLLADHQLDRQLGEQSPLGGLYELDGHVLFLGSGYKNCTTFHLAEYRQTDPPMQAGGAAVIEGGLQIWEEFQDIDLNDSDFPEIGAAFDATGASTIANVGSAECRLFSARLAVDFAVDWIPKNRKPG